MVTVGVSDLVPCDVTGNTVIFGIQTEQEIVWSPQYNTNTPTDFFDDFVILTFPLITGNARGHTNIIT